MFVLNALAPVFSIIALGFVLRKTQFLSESHFDGLNALTYWVGLPCFLFFKISTMQLVVTAARNAFLVVVLGMAGSVVFGFVVAALLRLPRFSVGAFVQAAFRGNLAFVGLPVIVYALGHGSPSEVREVETLAILVLAPMVPIYNVLSVVVLLYSSREREWAFGTLLRPVLTNPLVLASAAGAGTAWLFPSVPAALWRTTQALGQMSLPLALLGIGGSLATTRVHDTFRPAVGAALLKIAAAPLLGYLAVGWLGLSPQEARIALIYLACPTAAASYVLAEQLGGDSKLAAGAMVLSTALAVVSLSLAVAVPLPQ